MHTVCDVVWEGGSRRVCAVVGGGGGVHAHSDMLT